MHDFMKILDVAALLYMMLKFKFYGEIFNSVYGDGWAFFESVGGGWETKWNSLPWGGYFQSQDHPPLVSKME